MFRNDETRENFRSKNESACSVIALCVLAAALSVPHSLYAQVRPDAGQTLESVRPQALPPRNEPAGAALPAPDEPSAQSMPNAKRIAVRRWRFSGARAFSTVELNALIKDRLGQDLTLDDLNAAAARITAHYRQHGYLLSRAYLPAQDIHNGEVEIAVIEGRLANVKVDNTSPVNETVLGGHVERLKAVGPVQGRALERSLLLLNDLPGVEVRSTLQPGANVGSSDLELQVRGSGRVDGSIDADNYGNRYTGELRVGASINVNSPLGRGDIFSLRGLVGSGTNYGRASWQTPLGGNGWKAGIAWSQLQYELGDDFESLGADGDARVGTLWVAYPFMRSQSRNLTGRIAYDNKLLVDRIDVTATSSRRTLEVLTLALSGDWRDSFGGGGVTSYGLDVISGRLGLDPLTATLDSSAGGHNTEGSYGKLALSLSRLQRLSESVLLYAALSGQLSNGNLDSSEKQSLGGIYGVRAYPQGEASGDDAAIFNLELRWQVPGLPVVQALLFADAASVRANHSAIATDRDNRRTLTGEGIGAQWLRSGSFGITGHVAWRSGPLPTADEDRQPRYWLQMAQYF